MKKIVLSLVILFSIIAVMVHFNTPKEPTAWIEYKVCDGDTICDISRSITPDSIDYRETEYYIAKKNNIENALIYPNQIILIPVYE